MNAKSQKTLLVLFLLLWLVAPHYLPRHMVDLLVFSAIYALGGLGVAMLLGQCGIVNLAQSLFYGIGAYATANFAIHFGLPAPAGIIAGAVLSGALALIIGWPILRLSGFFLALATLALSLIGTVLFFEWDGLTGGTLGLGGIPVLAPFDFELNTPARFYYLVWIVLAIAMWLARNLIHGRLGLAMRAMRDAPAAAQVLSVNMHALKVQMFVICAVLGSVAGSLFAHYVTFVSVQSFSIDRAIVFLLIPVIAGAHSIYGVVLGALFITFLPEWLSGFGEIHQILFGLTLVLVVTLLPNGLTGIFSRAFSRTSKEAAHD